MKTFEEFNEELNEEAETNMKERQEAYDKWWNNRAGHYYSKLCVEMAEEAVKNEKEGMDPVQARLEALIPMVMENMAEGMVADEVGRFQEEQLMKEMRAAEGPNLEIVSDEEGA